MQLMSPKIQVLDPIHPGDDELLTTSGVNVRFNIDRDVLVRMRRSGVGPDYVQMPGHRQVRYSAGVIRQWIKANTISPQEAA